VKDSDPDNEITWQTTKTVYILGCDANPQINISDYDDLGKFEKV
jgi:hypothetical protein